MSFVILNIRSCFLVFFSGFFAVAEGFFSAVFRGLLAVVPAFGSWSFTCFRVVDFVAVLPVVFLVLSEATDVDSALALADETREYKENDER